MNEWIVWVVQGVTGIAVGLIGYFWKRDKDHLENRLAQVERDLKEMPFVYTTREDFIRSTTQIDRKLDKIYDLITQLKSNKEG